MVGSHRTSLAGLALMGLHLCAVMLLAVTHVVAEETEMSSSLPEMLPPLPGEYVGKLLLPAEGATGPGAVDFTDEPCSVTISQEGEQLVASASFAPGRATLRMTEGRPYYWGVLGSDQALVVWVGRSGWASIVTYTAIEADGLPPFGALGSEKFFAECLIMEPPGEPAPEGKQGYLQSGIVPSIVPSTS